MAGESDAQKETVARVMHEFKHGELRIRGDGPKVKSRAQAVAIALREAGATNREDAATNRANLKRTKAKERRGETAEAEAEGRGAQARTMKAATGAGSDAAERAPTRDELYAEARTRDLPGRSRMSKAELQRALAR